MSVRCSQACSFSELSGTEVTWSHRLFLDTAQERTSVRCPSHQVPGLGYMAQFPIESNWGGGGICCIATQLPPVSWALTLNIVTKLQLVIYPFFPFFSEGWGGCYSTPLILGLLESWEFASERVGMNPRQFPGITQDRNWAGPNINKNKNKVCEGHDILLLGFTGIFLERFNSHSRKHFRNESLWKTLGLGSSQVPFPFSTES